MDLTETVIKAVANLYTLDELRAELETAIKKMIKDPNCIISASTGAGASYTKSLNMTSGELVELLSLAVEYKTRGYIGSGSNIMNIVTLI